MSATKFGLEVLSKVRPIQAVNTNWEVGKYRNQLGHIQQDAGELERRFQKFNYVGQQYCRLGLLENDFLQEADSIVKMARKRMTDEQVQARYFRVNRAIILTANQQLLPPDQWTPMDAEHEYMRDILFDVGNEVHERKLMKCAMLDFEDSVERLMLTPFRLRYFNQIRNLRSTLKEQVVNFPV